MKVGMAVSRPRATIAESVAAMVEMARAAAAAGAELVAFAEAATTGLVNTDDPARDEALCARVDGEELSALRRAADDLGIDVVAGFFESAEGRIWDSAAWFSPGRPVAVYRRASRGWRGPRSDSSRYGEGPGPAAIDAGRGKACVLVCGDLWDDALLDSARRSGAALLAVPFARCFDEGADAAEEWARSERGEYAARAALPGMPAVLVNLLDERGGYFGGALAVEADGRVAGEAPPLVEGVFVAELESAWRD